MGDPLELKTHDTTPGVRVTLADKNGPVDLTTATTIKMVMLHPSTGLLTVTMTKDPDQTTNRGVATYDWTSGSQTAADGEATVEFEVTWSNGKKTTFPNVGTELIIFYQDLDDA